MNRKVQLFHVMLGWITACCLLATQAVAVDAPAVEWKPVPGKLMTRWAKDVSPTNARPEYPRPQMVRKDWQNLNGLWDYAIKPKADTVPDKFDGKILVPFPVESALSGVAKMVGPESRLWYRRTFAVPAGWREGGKRVLLHFGAVDWETTVWVNGKEARSGLSTDATTRPELLTSPHRGGYDPFSFDVTDLLEAGDGPQEIVVAVSDPTNASWQPRGKQVNKPGGIFYTPSTGIWQTVWIEPVPAVYISGITITPSIDDRNIRVLFHERGENKASTDGNRYSLSIFDGDKRVGGASSSTNAPIGAFLGEMKLWTPDHPHLYKLKISNGSDEIESYFAMRKISIGKDDKGVTRILLNNKFLFQYGTLDQGFWPDGLYTAPTDDALKYDLEVTKRLGFNMVRKHVKVEPDTWYAHCDRLGLLVWQDMASGDKSISGKAEDLKRSPESAANYEREWAAIISALYNHPCIVMWVPFNEGWGQFDTARIAELTKKLDPTRLVNSASGWTDRGVGDVHDLHIYPGPGSPRPEANRAAVLGEFGGLGLPVRGHTWQEEKNWGYRSFTSADALTDTYIGLLMKMHPLIGEPGLSAAVYTQTTDVETEVNGLMTYDRDIIKMDEPRIAATAKRLYGPPPITTTLVPTAREKEVEWKFTLERPADGWESADFNDNGWKSGPGGFGTAITPGAKVGTEWKTGDIWIRRSFELPENFAPGEGLHLMMHHDEDAEVYLNGVLANKTAGYTTTYTLTTLLPEARKALKPGKNVIAIHCHQSSGGQFIDAGLVDVK